MRMLFESFLFSILILLYIINSAYKDDQLVWYKILGALIIIFAGSVLINYILRIIIKRIGIWPEK